MIKNITHKELVSILMQIHDEIPSKFFQHWMRVTINKLNAYEERAIKSEKDLAFYRKSFEIIQNTEKKRQSYCKTIKGKNFITRFLESCKTTIQKND
jgi:hypothetical protein